MTIAFSPSKYPKTKRTNRGGQPKSGFSHVSQNHRLVTLDWYTLLQTITWLVDSLIHCKKVFVGNGNEKNSKEEITSKSTGNTSTSHLFLRPDLILPRQISHCHCHFHSLLYHAVFLRSSREWHYHATSTTEYYYVYRYGYQYRQRPTTTTTKNSRHGQGSGCQDRIWIARLENFAIWPNARERPYAEILPWPKSNCTIRNMMVGWLFEVERIVSLRICIIIPVVFPF